MNEMPGVTRFEVIDHRGVGVGRTFVANGVHVSIDLQDEGRTMKVFLNDPVHHLPGQERGVV